MTNRTLPGGWARAARAGLCAAMLLHLPDVAQAAEPAAQYPSHNILVLVPFPPGGPPDVLNRIIAQQWGEELGKPVVVENRPGASTAIASQAVARAAPDGYTLLATDISIAVVPHILANPGFDPLKDLIPVGPTARSVLTVVINPAVPANTVQDLVALAKAKPDDIKVGHSGIGTPPHLGAVAFLQATKTRMLLVPYRGAALALNDVVAGHMSMLVTAPSTSIALTREGKVRMLGVTGGKRITALPDVPTLRENGIEMAGVDDGVWFGITAPAATPADIVSKLNATLNKAVQHAAVREKLAMLDITAGGGTPHEFGQHIATQLEFWREPMRAAGVKPE